MLPCIAAAAAAALTGGGKMKLQIIELNIWRDGTALLTSTTIITKKAAHKIWDLSDQDKDGLLDR